MIDSERLAFERWLNNGHHCGANENMWKAWLARSLLDNPTQGADAQGPQPFGTARARFLSGEPVQMSDEVRRLAKKVLEQRDQPNTESPEEWAERITNNMYGGADARPVAITDESIIAAFEYEMMNDPDAYTRPEECVYQITNKELLSATKKLLATRDAAPGDEKLHTFLNAAAGEGFVLDGVDAAELYIDLFPERYAAIAPRGKT